MSAPLPAHPVEAVPIADLRPHPRNYRAHPADQIAHLKKSLEENGLYRNVVVAQDGTILAGHGVVQAARELGLERVNVVRLPIEPGSRAALKVMTADNEIEHLAEQDDRLLTELLKEIGAVDVSDLLGTGYDAPMVANLAYVTRPATEIRDHDAAAEWAGMPEYTPHAEDSGRLRLVVSFAGERERADFYQRLGVNGPSSQSASMWWPLRQQDDVASVRLAEAGA